jgi:hypothetical protein
VAEHSGESWSDEDVEKLRDLAASNTPVGQIGNELGRSEDAMYAKAEAEKISLQPPNRSPYGKLS